MLAHRHGHTSCSWQPWAWPAGEGSDAQERADTPLPCPWLPLMVGGWRPVTRPWHRTRAVDRYVQCDSAASSKQATDARTRKQWIASSCIQHTALVVLRVDGACLEREGGSSGNDRFGVVGRSWVAEVDWNSTPRATGNGLKPTCYPAAIQLHHATHALQCATCYPASPISSRTVRGRDSSRVFVYLRQRADGTAAPARISRQATCAP